jgi:outer membrane protein assembly factor BamB
MMMQLSEQGAKVTGRTLFKLPATVFGSEQQTPIFYKGNIYGVSSGGQLTCLNLQGKVLWTSGSTAKFGLGPYLIADGLLYVLDDKGNLTMTEATPNGFNPLSKAKVLSGPDAWGPMVIVGGRLLCRDLTRMVCLDVAKK